MIPTEKAHRRYQQAEKVGGYIILAFPLQKALKPSVSFSRFFSYASKGTSAELTVISSDFF
jgi:polysaccharide deacetylase 2 family uncharacterized protein YibQ